MLKNKNLSVTFFILCALLLGAKSIFAQAVTDNSKDSQINAALDQQENPAAAQPQPAPSVEQPSAKIVKAIDIQGNKSIGIAQILARIKTRVGEEYQDAVVSDDLKR